MTHAELLAAIQLMHKQLLELQMRVQKLENRLPPNTPSESVEAVRYCWEGPAYANNYEGSWKRL